MKKKNKYRLRKEYIKKEYIKKTKGKKLSLRDKRKIHKELKEEARKKIK